MKKTTVIICLLIAVSNAFADNIFFGGSGNLTPAGSGNIFSGYSYDKGAAVVLTYYGTDIFSLDLVVYKYEGLALSYGGSLSRNRENDFITILFTPKIIQFRKQWKIFGKIGLNINIGGVNPNREIIFGVGLRYK